MAAGKQEGKMGLEDHWTWTTIGQRFPEGPVRVKGETNQFVALWYHNGKPMFGRAWNECGKVMVAFPVGDMEMKGAKDLGGSLIQILTHPGNFARNGFWYDWRVLAEAKTGLRAGKMKLVRCGDSAPIYHRNRKGQTSVGNLALKTETASVAFDGNVERYVKPAEVAAMLVPCMNFQKPGSGEGLGFQVVEQGGSWRDDLWADFRVGDKFPSHTVHAAARPLNFDGTGPMEFSVALWYSQGVPVIGRAWAENGAIQVSFGWNGEEFTGDSCGSVQLLQHHLPSSHGFDYTWLPFSQIREEPNPEGWRSVNVSGIVPCVCITKDGFERPGQLDSRVGTASFGFDGREASFSGAKLEPFLVLVRKDLPPSH